MAFLYINLNHFQTKGRNDFLQTALLTQGVYQKKWFFMILRGQRT